MKVYSIWLLFFISGLAAAETQTDLWQLYQEANSADPRILKAAAQIRSDYGRKREALGQMLPQANASGSFNRSQRYDEITRTTYNGTRYAVGISQAIYDPQAWRSYQKFSALAAQTDLEYQDAGIQSSIDLAERYFAVLAAEDELRLAEAELQATARNLEQVNALYERKMAMVTDVLELKARLDTLDSSKMEAENQVEITREAISELVGRPVTEPLKRFGDTPRFTLPAQGQDYWVNMASTHNPALKAKERQLDAADAAISEAKAGHLPKLGLSLTAQRSDIGYEATMTPRTDAYVASVDLQIPLYSGGATSARVSSLHGDKDVAMQELEALRRQVVRETRTAFYSLTSGIARIKATKQALGSTQKSREATEKAFRFGVKNAVDVLDSTREEFRARRDLAKSHYTYITNLLLLHRWSGRLTDADIRTVNNWFLSP